LTEGSTRRWVAAREQLSCEVGDEVVILNLADNTYYGLPEVGAFVWQLLSEPRTLDELRDAVVAEFEVAPEVCETDVVHLLEDLRARELVRPAD
jgi:hypothetical protein